MKVGIVIPVLNQFRLATEAIWSAKSKFDLQFYVQPNWILNRGVAGAWNDGVKQAYDDRCDYVMVINDDVVLSPWAIDNQIAAIQNDESKLLHLTSGWNIGALKDNAIDIINYPEPDSNAWIPGVDFSCFVITKYCFEVVGNFDENFWPAYFEDNDYHRRVLMQGLTGRIVTSAPFYHYGSQTQQTPDGVSSKMFDKNKDYYVHKWGGLPGAEIYSSPYNKLEASVAYIE